MTWGVNLLGFGALLDALDGIQMRLDDNAVYVVGTNVEYSIYVELGTSRMAAQPYLIPAAREAARSAERIAGDASSVDEAVKRIAFFIERRAKQEVPVDTGNLKASIRTERIR